MSELKLFNTTEKSTWCPGCGDFGILAGVKAALAALDLMPHQAMIVSGIGCGSKLPHYMTVNAYNSLHGRAVPIAQGIKLANHNLKVIIVTGDGDGYGIGANHLMQGMRRNADVTHIIENNQIYGLTKGQYSPTSDKGVVTSFSPEGSIEVGPESACTCPRMRRDIYLANVRGRREAHVGAAAGSNPASWLFGRRHASAVRYL